jgi:acetate kinase
LLYRRSGLLGVSGISGDVRVLLSSDDPHAATRSSFSPIDRAGRQARWPPRWAGSTGWSLPPVSVSTPRRSEHAVCARLSWLGLRIDDAANTAKCVLHQYPGQPVEVLVIPTERRSS